MRKLLLLVALILALLLAKAPAAIVDVRLAHFTDGALRLQQA